jgi:hypothetical protein
MRAKRSAMGEEEDEMVPISSCVRDRWCRWACHLGLGMCE